MRYVYGFMTVLVGGIIFGLFAPESMQNIPTLFSMMGIACLALGIFVRRKTSFRVLFTFAGLLFIGTVVWIVLGNPSWVDIYPYNNVGRIMSGFLFALGGLAILIYLADPDAKRATA